jgi:hypothetical protein
MRGSTYISCAILPEKSHRSRVSTDVPSREVIDMMICDSEAIESIGNRFKRRSDAMLDWEFFGVKYVTLFALCSSAGAACMPKWTTPTAKIVTITAMAYMWLLHMLSSLFEPILKLLFLRAPP